MPKQQRETMARGPCGDVGRTGAKAAATLALAALALVPLTGCGSDGDDGDGAVDVPKTYSFDSRINPGSSSVAYGGQVNRQVLIARMNAWIDGLTVEIDGGKVALPGEVTAALAFYLDFDATTSADVAHGLTTTPAPKQTTWGQLGGKKVMDKLAGNDKVGQHRDWGKDGLIGWPGAATPEALVRAWAQQLEALALARGKGEIAKGADGKPIAKVHVSAEGLDLKELLQKFVLGAVAYSQGADDYLDDDVPGSGLLSDHSKAAEAGKPYTALEHAWDEGFGYFGAARDYHAYSDAELANKAGDAQRRKGHFDSDGDGKIDLFAEANFGHALNCSKRDHGAVGKADIDLSGRAFSALVRGRALIAATKLGPVPEATLAKLRAERDAALAAWEECLAATVVHYLNACVADLAAIDGGTWSHGAAAKHWSELKGFALSLQFSRHSMLSKGQQATLHGLIGVAPVLATATAEARSKGKADLLAARKLVVDAFGFAAALAGDDQGAGGW